MSAHTGTHVDAPRHFFDSGSGTEALPLDLLLGRARVIEVESRTGIAAEDLERVDFSDDIRLLIKTHNSTFWGDATFHDDYVGVTDSGAKYLVGHGIKVVGVDYLSVEKFHNPGAPAHHVLLGAGTIVIEGLNLRDVEPVIYELICLPLRFVRPDGPRAALVLRRS